MAHFRQKTFQLKTSSSSIEKLSDFNCIAPKNQLIICVNNAENGTQNHNKSFGMLLKVNLSSTYKTLVNKSKVKLFKKQRLRKSEIKLKTCTKMLFGFPNHYGREIKMSGRKDFFLKTFGCFAKKTYLCTAFFKNAP